MMNEEEVEQLSILNRKVFNGEPLTDQQETLRHELTALRAQQLGNLISRYLYIPVSPTSSFPITPVHCNIYLLFFVK